jgi:hypothetical protein
VRGTMPNTRSASPEVMPRAAAQNCPIWTADIEQIADLSAVQIGGSVRVASVKDDHAP